MLKVRILILFIGFFTTIIPCTFGQGIGETKLNIWCQDFLGGRDRDNADYFVQRITIGSLAEKCLTTKDRLKVYDYQLGYNMPVNNSLKVSIKIITHRDFKGHVCEVDKRKDRKYGNETTVNVILDLSKFKPGVMNTKFFMCDNNKITFRFIYQVPKPDNITIDNSSYLCINNPITLNTAINKIPSNSSNVNLTWQYHIAGDQITEPCDCGPNALCPNGTGCRLPDGSIGCYDSYSGNCNPVSLPPCCDNPVVEDVWNTLGVTNYNDGVNSFSFLGQNYAKILAAVSSNSHDVHFRVRASDGTASILSNTKIGQISAAPPTVSNITRSPSCANANDGSISFNISGGGGNYRWSLQERIPDCSISDIKDGKCFSSDIAGQGNTSAGRVTAQAGPGEYYLYVQNWKSSQSYNPGGCYNEYGPFIIEEIPPLELDSVSVTELSCYESNDGSITVSASDGDAGTIKYGLNLKGETTVWQDDDTFESLEAGTYVAWVQDRCDVYSSEIEVVQPTAPIAATASFTAPVCHDAGDGTISVIPTGGYGDYAITLYKGSDVVKQFNVYNDSEEVVFTNLGYGDYTWEVQDSEKACTIIDGSFHLPEPTRITMEVQEIIPVTCPVPAANDGEVHFTVYNNAFPYTITMTDEQTGQDFTSNTNIVSNLPAGDYEVSISYNNGCTDVYTLAELVEIEQPTPIIVKLVKDDMTCTDSFDASISASISGGNTGDYSYRWQVQSAGVWGDFTDQERTDDLLIHDLFDGIYRLYVTDSKGCEKASAAVEIVNPEPLVIEDVLLVGLACKEEENGHILPEVTGGWGNYQYEYIKLPDTQWQVYDLTDNFDQGTYKIRVSDPEGCSVEWEEDLLFAEADQPLELTGLTSKKYNGFDISCFGSFDGEVTVSAQGGITTSQQGYQYAADDGEFGGSSTVTGLSSGLHTLYVRDLNGCLKSQDIELIEPSALTIALDDIKHVKCFGDSSGYIQVAGNGGVTSYRFSINESPFMGDSLFTNLTSGDYQVIIQDRNTCRDTLNTEIINLFPPIEFDWQVDSVTCYNYSDGAAQVTIVGGHAPYAINWMHDINNQQQSIAYVTDGWYEIRVQDQEGCIWTDSVFVPEPPNINAGPDLNLCYEQSATLDASWPQGNATYSWSGVEGQLTTEPTLWVDQPGDYYAQASLNTRACLMYDTISISSYDIEFEAKFLAATELVVGDTLQLVETSTPTPDSLYWRFDDQATVLTASNTIPTLWFDQAGDYTISFAAYYGPCTDSLTKTVSVFLPEEAPETVDQFRFGQTGFKDVRIYPNPSDGEFTLSVELHEDDVLGIVIVSTMGMEEYRDNYDEADSFEINFDLSDKQAGAYLMRLVTSNDQMTLRIVIE
ncbi:T9SS type A sorting domain-containing protein [Fulvivirga maritima]|uniref:T9SS type A sorting domain-containing protein n=1 Tax=Fulvivirga maritima TaxID=2904247 RepID=UPI001F266501|nr:T9SS type A sorting domain-containing protein [Fulvivirga maritima]UII27543.1 T9SS type A sorting domain-containing protein [Fulvivirga maritima]